MADISKYNLETLDAIADDLKDIDTKVSKMVQDTQNYLGDVDFRVYQHFLSDFSGTMGANSTLYNSNRNTSGVETWLRDLNDEVRKIDGSQPGPETSDIDGDVTGGTGGGDGANLGTDGIGSDMDDGTSEIKGVKFTPDPAEWDKLTPGEKEAFVKKLKQAGYTDEEIKKIIVVKNKIVNIVAR